MPLRIEEDFDKISGGHAILDLGVALGEADAGLHITRLGGDPDKLGPNGWQSQPALLAPGGTRDAGASSQLLLGPEICDFLEEHDEVRIEVPGLSLSETTIWPYVAPSVDKDRRIGGAFTPPLPPEPPKAPIEPPKRPDPKPAPPGPGTNGPTEPTPPISPQPPMPDPKGRPVILGLGLLAAVAAVAVVVFWLRPDEGPAPITPVTPVAEDVTPEELMDAARACMDSGCPASDFVDISTQQQALGDIDGAYRTMSIAATKGDGSASLWLGQVHDPGSFDAEAASQMQLDGPDAGRALSFYATAAEQGAPDAAGLTETLCAALATVAEDGAPPQGFAEITADLARETIEQGCTE